MNQISILGQNIKRIRQSKNISAALLSKLAGVGAATISQIESGKRQTLQGDTINKIAAAFNVSVNELLGEDGMINFETNDLCDILSIILNGNFLELDGSTMTYEEKLLLQTNMTMFISAIRYQREKDRD